VAIVGYTNTGKSSLLNELTGADIIIQDALFATLDTTTRHTGHPLYTITDTVGFIQDLPTTLVEAFRTTLEEAVDCDILVHVVDATAPNPDKQIATVNEVLASIRSVDGEGKIVLKEPENEVLVFNKIDLLSPDELARIQRKYPHAKFISVQEKQGIDDLLETIKQKIERVRGYHKVTLTIPYTDGKKLAQIYQEGEVLSRKETPDGYQITAMLRT
jgi:GTP-binding protein HflX